jgi:nicotinamide phosphoribosyltransferase
MAMIDGKEVQIFKDPATDDGTKKSNTGVVAVQEVDGELVCIDGLSLDDDVADLMRPIFRDGKLLVDDDWATIKERIAATK